MSLFKKDLRNKIKKQYNWKIERKCLNLIFEAAKSTYPNEFGGLLRVDTDNKDIISELIILPGTIQGDSHTIFNLHMMPIDFYIVGTVHSHPSISFYPSNADLLLFQKKGKIHIISAYPYNFKSYRSYNRFGKMVNLEIV
jgi:proteasome lid subunit RPN8/RPN11